MDIYVSYTCLKITSVFHITLNAFLKYRKKLIKLFLIGNIYFNFKQN